MDQQIRFCTTDDGVRVAFASSGSGPPLVKTAHWLTHLDLDWGSPVWRHWLTELSYGQLLVRYDARGCGLSDWDVPEISFEAWVRDLEAVVEAAGLERFPLLGVSQGAAVAIAYAVRHPERVTRLVLYGGYARGRLQRDPTPHARREAETMENLMALGWGKHAVAFRQVFANLLMPGATREQMDWLTELQRVSTDADNALRIERTSYDIDVSELARQVSVPTLVLHARDDAMIGIDQGRELATLIPGARFVPLDSANHVLMADEPEWPRFLDVVRAFLGVAPDSAAPVSEGSPSPATPTDGITPDSMEPSAYWLQARRLFDELADTGPTSCEARLREVRDGDPKLVEEVERMLAADTDAEARLDPFRDAAAGLILEVTGGSSRPDPLGRLGTRVGRYLVDALIGVGGMGVLYRATDVRLDRAAVLKFLNPALSLDATAKRRFLHEARAASSLDHPNVCTIYGAEETMDGALFIAMAAYEGETVRERLDRGSLTAGEALDLAIQAARGLAAAHARGLIHRDIKPANLLVTRDGLLKILDFGVAKAPDLDLTRPDQRPGTVGYMAPEQERGDPVDPKVDIWSLGMVLHEMLTGAKPSRMRAVARGTSSVVSATGQPEPMVRLVDRMLAFDPDARPTATEVIQACSESGAVGSGDPGGPEHAVDFADRCRAVAVLPFKDLSSDGSQGYFCEGMAEEILDALTRVDRLRVASRLSSFHAGPSADIAFVGRALDVDTVIEGSVRKAGSRIRISARLVRTPDGSVLWSERYDRELEDVFAIQEDIARSIAHTLVPSRTGEPTAPPRAGRAAAVEAYDHYLRGRQAFLRDTRVDLEAARRMFARAIHIDPDYARAWAGLSDACAYLHKHFDRDSELLEEADRASRRAVELEPALADALTSRAVVHWLQDRVDDAATAFGEAIRLDPASFEAHYLFGQCAYSCGQPERAAEQFEAAAALRPDDFQAPILLGTLRRLAGGEDRAREAFERGLERAQRRLRLNPNDVRARYLGAFALIGTGRVAEGLDWSLEALHRAPDDAMVLYNVAAAHAVAGRVGDALAYLDRALDAGFGHRPDLLNDPDLTAVRAHPRFQTLLARLPPGEP